jgi:hypothetical protein
MDLGYATVVLLSMALLPAWIARRRGHSFLVFYLYGMALLPLAVLHALTLDDRRGTSRRLARIYDDPGQPG